MKNSTPLAELNDAELTTRTYNLGLKIVPNLVHVLTRDDLEYWESHLGELKEGLRNGFVQPLFELVTTFKVTVAESYEHTTRLASFAKENRDKFSYYNNNVTDENFAKATQKLTPEKTYTAKIWGIKRGQVVSSPDCLAFLKTQKVILTGAQGLTLAWEQAKEKFPKGKWTASFDEKDALPILGGHRAVPSVCAFSGGVFLLALDYFERDSDYDDCLLGFCDE